MASGGQPVSARLCWVCMMDDGVPDGAERREYGLCLKSFLSWCLGTPAPETTDSCGVLAELLRRPHRSWSTSAAPYIVNKLL